MRRVLVVILVVMFAFAGGFMAARADELDDINKQLESLQADLKKKESDHTQLSKQLNDIRAQVGQVDTAIVVKEQEVRTGEKALAYQTRLLEERVASYYKNSQQGVEMLVSLFGGDFATSLKSFLYQQYIIEEDRRTITRIVSYVQDLNQKKEELKSEKSRLAVIKDQIDKQTAALGAEIEGTRSQIASLTARQQQIVAAKLASLNIPRSAGTSARGCSSDLTNGRSAGFSPTIGFFTYGAPHRNGLNQYGAKGRADAGQNAEQMLSEYYPNMSLKKDYDANAQVNVDGHGTFNIEDYTKRIYEVPADWPMETLKAQAVAARTYALNSMQRNGSICTSEACQVFQPNEKGGRWNEAVDATRGWVLMDGGNPGFTQYASTHGGYIQNLGKFDGSGGNPGSFGDLNSRAYDKDSPWFYCNWGSRSEYGGTAWLKADEVADIFNVIMLARYSDVDKEHLYQTDKPNPAGKETWSSDKVKSELRARGGSAVDSVSDVSIGVDFGSGKTTSVSGGSASVSGDEFKNWFNLRAPANIQIVGPLFNVEKR